MHNRQKTRSDYHSASLEREDAHPFGLHSCLKALFWMTLGAAIGMSYNKQIMNTCQDRLAFIEAERTTVVQADQDIESVIIASEDEVHHATTHAIAKGKMPSSA